MEPALLLGLASALVTVVACRVGLRSLGLERPVPVGNWAVAVVVAATASGACTALVGCHLDFRPTVMIAVWSAFSAGAAACDALTKRVPTGVVRTGAAVSFLMLASTWTPRSNHRRTWHCCSAVLNRSGDGPLRLIGTRRRTTRPARRNWNGLRITIWCSRRAAGSDSASCCTGVMDDQPRRITTQPDSPRPCHRRVHARGRGNAADLITRFNPARCGPASNRRRPVAPLRR